MIHFQTEFMVSFSPGSHFQIIKKRQNLLKVARDFHSKQQAVAFCTEKATA